MIVHYSMWSFHAALLRLLSPQHVSTALPVSPGFGAKALRADTLAGHGAAYNKKS